MTRTEPAVFRNRTNTPTVCRFSGYKEQEAAANRARVAFEHTRQRRSAHGRSVHPTHLFRPQQDRELAIERPAGCSLLSRSAWKRAQPTDQRESVQLRTMTVARIAARLERIGS